MSKWYEAAATTQIGSIASITRGMHWHVVAGKHRLRVVHTSTGYVDAFQRAANIEGSMVICSREGRIALEGRLNHQGTPSPRPRKVA